MARPRGRTPLVVMARQVRTRVRLSFEVEGVYLSVESLELSAADIRIESISQHSRRYFRILPYLLLVSLIYIRIEPGGMPWRCRWGLLISTVSTMQRLLKGFLERRLLTLLTQVGLFHQGHHDVIRRQ